MSFTYAIFGEGTDIYWARTRVLEQLGGSSSSCRQASRRRSVRMRAASAGSINTCWKTAPAGWISPNCAPCRISPSARRSRRSPAWPKSRLLGGFERQYQIVIDPDRLVGFGLTVTDITRSVRDANAEVGARVLELAGREYVLRGRGYVKDLKDLEQSVVAVGTGGTPIRLARRRHRPLRAGNPPRRRGLERHRRGGRRHRGDADRLECPAGHPRTRIPDCHASPSRWRPADSHLRPVGADPRVRRDADRHAPPAGDHRHDHLPGVPVPRAIGAHRHDRAAAVGAAVVHRHPLSRPLVQHHVARRHRHRHRRAGGCRHRAHRERARPPGGGAARSRPATGHRRRLQGSRPSDLLLAAADHRQLPAHLHAGRPGGPAVHAARLHEDVRDVRGGDAVHHARAAADGAAAEGPLPHRGRQSGEPVARPRLPAHCGAGRPVPDRRGRRRGPPHDCDRADLPAPRVGVHAAARRGIAAGDAHHVPRYRHRGSASRADRAEPHHHAVSRDRLRARQSGPCRDRDRSRAARHDRIGHRRCGRDRVADAVYAPLVQRRAPGLGEARRCGGCGPSSRRGRSPSSRAIWTLRCGCPATRWRSRRRSAHASTC